MRTVGFVATLLALGLAAAGCEIVIGIKDRSRAADGGPDAEATGSGGAAGATAPQGSGGHFGVGGMSGCVRQPVIDAGPDAASLCGARFNFENCALYGAFLNFSDLQLGFKSFSVTSSPTFCGAGALQIDVALDPSDAGTATGRGELFLTIPGAPIDISGKTVTARFMANPATSTPLKVYIVVVAQVGYLSGALTASPIPADHWATASVTFDVVDGSVMLVDRISIQANGSEKYVGTIYVDEIDITPH